MARRRDHWTREIGRLDPEIDYCRIAYLTGAYEFPWDIQQALSLALFRTYAVPSIGRLLYDTGAFTGDVQKRHDDTLLILFTISNEGLESAQGRAAIRRMNQMHGSYDIAGEDFRYVLSAFVVAPTRWIEQFGWRKGLPAERIAAVNYYRRLGKLMGIKDIPNTYEEFEELFESYEQQHFAFDEKTRAVADSTMALFETFYPSIVRKPVNAMLRSLMDDHLLEAYKYEKPGAFFTKAVSLGLKSRARFISLLPARKGPKTVRDFREVRSYPHGFEIDELGTVASGCPVQRSSDPDRYR